jgi:hypothetical protein
MLPPSHLKWSLLFARTGHAARARGGHVAGMVSATHGLRPAPRRKLPEVAFVECNGARKGVL